MQMYQFNDHFTLNLNHNLTKFLRRLIFLILFASIYDIASAKISIAIIDTGFCSNERIINKIKINAPVDLTNTNVKLNCDNNFLKHPRFHGENVLNVLTHEYQGNHKLIIQPLVIYDNRGETKKNYWLSAIKYIKEMHFDYIISAVGIKDGEMKITSGNSKWLLSAPRVSPNIKMDDSIFPQNQFLNKNVLLVGSYTPPNFIDQGLLYKDKIKYYVKDSNSEFNGSSFAVAFFAGKYFSKCHNSNEHIQCTEFLNSIKMLAN